MFIFVLTFIGFILKCETAKFRTHYEDEIRNIIKILLSGMVIRSYDENNFSTTVVKNVLISSIFLQIIRIFRRKYSLLVSVIRKLYATCCDMGVRICLHHEVILAMYNSKRINQIVWSLNVFLEIRLIQNRFPKTMSWRQLVAATCSASYTLKVTKYLQIAFCNKDNIYKRISLNQASSYFWIICKGWIIIFHDQRWWKMEWEKERK